MAPPFAPSASSGGRDIDEAGSKLPLKEEPMVTQDQIDQIKATGRRSQGPLIDKALATLLQNGRNHKEAFAELGEALGMNPNTVAQGFYRRKRQKGEGRPMVRVRSDVAPTPEVAQATARRSPNGTPTTDAQAELLALIDRIVEARVNERLAEVRRVLGQ